MDILYYLTSLLKTSKAVGIAGLGTFYKKKSPGRYDAAQHAFVPPNYTLVFDNKVEETEGLAYFISTERNITTDSANYYIGEFAEKIQAQLADQQVADLGELGQLRLMNDQVTFIASEQNQITNESFGLPVLPVTTESSSEKPVENEYLTTIEEENKREEENPGLETTDFPIADDQPIFDEITEIEDRTEPVYVVPPIIETTEDIEEVPVEEKVIVEPINDEVVIEEVYEEEPKKGTSFWIKFLIAIFIILAAGALAYFINPDFFNKYFKHNIEPRPPVVTTPKVDTVKRDSTQIDSLAKNNAMVTLARDTAVVDSTKVYYEVFGTTESSQKRADAYIARVAKLGIVAKSIRASKTKIRVSLGTFTDKQQAIKYADSLAKRLKNPEIYAQPMKPKKHTK